MSVPTTDAHGITIWRNDNGEAHRDSDLPAVVWPSGLQEWWRHGQQHRDDDLPAVVWPDGSRYWFQHGKQHRDGDLPAVVHCCGRQEWWVNNSRQTPADREQTRRVMAEQARRWSPLRAAFVGAVAGVAKNA
jgi:hypothetical protein